MRCLALTLTCLGLLGAPAAAQRTPDGTLVAAAFIHGYDHAALTGRWQALIRWGDCSAPVRARYVCTFGVDYVRGVHAGVSVCAAATLAVVRGLVELVHGPTPVVCPAAIPA